MHTIIKIQLDYTPSSDAAIDSFPITAITLFVGGIPRICKIIQFAQSVHVVICIVDHGSFELQESYPLLLPATKAAINTKLDQN